MFWCLVLCRKLQSETLTSLPADPRLCQAAGCPPRCHQSDGTKKIFLVEYIWPKLDQIIGLSCENWSIALEIMLRVFQSPPKGQPSGVALLC